MTWIYLASLIFGAAFVIPMMLGGLDLEVDVPGMEGDVDLDLEVDADSGGGSVVDGPADLAGSFLSFRSLTMFATFFGLSGLVLGFLSDATAPTLIAAILLGVGAAGLQTKLFNYLARTDSSSQLTAADLRGITAEVVLPISDERKGRIKADVEGQPTFLVARPFTTGDAFEVGQTVVVVEVLQGTAAVTALDI